MAISFGGLLRSLDIYGHKIGVHYGGEDTFKTGFGGFMTCATYILILINAIGLVTDFTQMTQQTENSNRIKPDLLKEGDINLQENQFDIMISQR